MPAGLLTREYNSVETYTFVLINGNDKTASTRLTNARNVHYYTSSMATATRGPLRIPPDGFAYNI